MAENLAAGRKESRKESSLLKDALALFVITLVAAAALGFVYELTKDTIAERERQEKEAAYLAVCPGAAQIAEDAGVTAMVGQAEEILAEGGYTGAMINEALLAYDESGEAMGYAINVSSMNGYGGEIALSMGYTADGVLLGIRFTTLDETVGLGARADEDGEGSFKEQFTNRQAQSFTVVKSEASADNEISAISGATVTSEAVVEAVNAGMYFAERMLENNTGGIGQ